MNEQNVQKEFYTWQQFEEDCAAIAEWARPQNFKTIYGIPRGGLVIAVRLSHLLDVPVMLTKDGVTKQTLIVDDIVDTGNTIQQLLAQLGSGSTVASLFHAEDASFIPHFFARRKKAWVVFPWETAHTSRYDNTIVV